MRSTNHNGRNTAMLIGGIAAGIVGSRMLPPVIAALSGRRRVRAGGDPFALLIDDHRRILSILDQMAASPTSPNLRRGRLFLMLKRKLAKHALAEEDVVYPIVHPDSGETNERKHLYDEHADMKVLLYEIERRVMNRQDWGDVVGPLRDLVRRHAEEEETTVFPELRRQLDQSRLPQVSGQISREEALIV
jgi:hemerythrin superfamily protein